MLNNTHLFLRIIISISLSLALSDLSGQLEEIAEDYAIESGQVRAEAIQYVQFREGKNRGHREKLLQILCLMCFWIINQIDTIKNNIP